MIGYFAKRIAEAMAPAIAEVLEDVIKAEITRQDDRIQKRVQRAGGVELPNLNQVQVDPPAGTPMRR